MPSYHIWTIGCQMNRAESDRLGGYLEGLGYRPADVMAEADLILLNSCVVRNSAESRVTNRLDLLRPWKKSRPGLILGVTGCFVNGETDRLKKRYPHVDFFFKPGDLPPLGGTAVPVPKPNITALVPIIQGCDNFCSFCIVPYRRGREKSRPVAEIVCEVRELARRGTREVTLLGQNVDSYGHDLPGKPHLADLLAELNAIEGLARIRFLTNHPKDMDARLIEAIATLDKVCEQVNLPVQSGSDGILQAMRRGYTASQYLDLVARVRQAVPEIALSTDVIVGFPGETPEQFQQTLDLLKAVKFDTVHVAVYSPRPGTIAARELADNVPKAEKKSRLAQVEEQQRAIVTEINARLLGRRVEILVESQVKGKWQGRTRGDKPVFFEGELSPGRLQIVEIINTGPWSLQGKPIKEVS